MCTCCAVCARVSKVLNGAIRIKLWFKRIISDAVDHVPYGVAISKGISFILSKLNENDTIQQPLQFKLIQYAKKKHNSLDYCFIIFMLGTSRHLVSRLNCFWFWFLSLQFDFFFSFHSYGCLCTFQIPDRWNPHWLESTLIQG